MAQLWMFLGVALPTLAALLAPMPTVDLAYQLRAGADILNGHGIPATDTWTFTIAGTTWLDQQWGAQVLLAAVFQVAGWTGLAVLRAALVAATFWLVTITLRAMGCAARPAALLALAGFVLAAPALALRPQLFAIALFAAVLAILAARARHPRRLLLLPLIAIAWANLHGSFPLIVVLLGLGWADELGRVFVARAAIRPGHGPARATAAIRGSTGIALLAAVSALATLATPFGIDGWRYVAHLASDPTVTSAVSEWRPPSPLEPVGALFYLSLLIGIVVVALRIRADGNRIGPATFAPIATLVVFGVLGALTARGLAWWALVLPVSASALTHDGGLTRFLPHSLDGLPTILTGPAAAAGSPPRAPRRSPLNAIVAVALALVGIILLPLWRPIGPAGVPAGTLSDAPQGIATQLDFLVSTGALGNDPRVWAPQLWGSWLEYSVPGARFAVDSRIELFPPEVWADAQAIAAGSGDPETILDRDKVVALIVPKTPNATLISGGPTDAIIAALARAGIWKQAYEDDDGAIYVRLTPLT